MFDRFANVVFRDPAPELTYRIPPGMEPSPGSRVQVPLGNRTETGLVVSISDQSSVGAIKDIAALLDPQPIVTEAQIQLSRKLADYYVCEPGEALFKMFPAPPGSFRLDAKRPLKIPGFDFSEKEPVARHRLNEEQSAIFDSIQSGNAGAFHLIHGITGSGKTEIYIHLLQKAWKSGRGGILLVPEIALTVQMIQRLQEVFGQSIALLHSGLAARDRFLNYLSVLAGKRRLVVGTRSAIFAPVPSPAYIIIDEEHDSSYRENSAPRYDARLISRWIVEESGGSIVAGSATPRLESRRACDTHPRHFFYHPIRSRASGQLPDVEVVNAPDKNPVSGKMITMIEQNLKNGRQTILLLNRRGYQPFIYCDHCGSTLQCPRCSVTLHFHKPDQLVCHYCSMTIPYQGKCIQCGKPARAAGTGVQRLEEFLGSRFPEARLERVDTDTSRGGKNLQDCLQRFFNGELDILMGTQMIAKGLDAPNVTLVGVLQADQGLLLSDYRAQERTFSLLMQVAGRAGRGNFKGQVLLEALNPSHPIIQQASAQDYDAFYNEELALRKATWYPPFCRLVRMLVRSPDAEYAEKKIDELFTALQSKLQGYSDQDLQILGPAPAPIEKIHEQFRWHILIKTRSYERIRGQLREVLESFRPGLTKGHLEFEPDTQDIV